MKTPAYFDTFAGLVPCKVIAINDANAGVKGMDGRDWTGCTSGCEVTFKLTANRGAYKRGEVLTDNALHVIPRSYVRGNRILGGYRWTKESI